MASGRMPRLASRRMTNFSMALSNDFEKIASRRWPHLRSAAWKFYHGLHESGKRRPRGGSDQPVRPEQRLDIRFGARAEVADHLGGGDAAHAAGLGQRLSGGQTVKEPGGE